MPRYERIVDGWYERIYIHTHVGKRLLVDSRLHDADMVWVNRMLELCNVKAARAQDV